MFNCFYIHKAGCMHTRCQVWHGYKSSRQWQSPQQCSPTQTVFVIGWFYQDCFACLPALPLFSCCPLARIIFPISFVIVVKKKIMRSYCCCGYCCYCCYYVFIIIILIVYVKVILILYRYVNKIK